MVFLRRKRRPFQRLIRTIFGPLATYRLPLRQAMPETVPGEPLIRFALPLRIRYTPPPAKLLSSSPNAASATRLIRSLCIGRVLATASAAQLLSGGEVRVLANSTSQ